MTSKLLRMCCVCKKINNGNKRGWVSKEENPVKYDIIIDAFENRITHGYCPKCYEKKLKMMGFYEDE